ncbi:MAG: heparinase II/III family protein [Planctomycetales bacterium]
MRPILLLLAMILPLLPTVVLAQSSSLPRVDIPRELPEHPRLFLNEQEIKELRAWIAREDWLQHYVDEMVMELEKTVDSPKLPDRHQGGNTPIARQAHRYAIAYVLQDDLRFAKATAKILNAYVEHFPGYPVTNLKGKATAATLGECDWAVDIASAYDLIYQSGVLNDKQKQAIEQEVLKPSAEAMRNCNHHFRSTWRGRAIAGVGVIGFCINDRELIDEAINGYRDSTGRLVRDGLVQHVAWSILADGVFYERSMHYHMYTADAYTLIAEAARHSGIDLWNLEISGHPLDAGADSQRDFGQTGTKTMKAIFDSPFYEAFSDHSLVRLGNSYTDRLQRARCYERAWHAYRDPKYAWILNRPVDFYRPIAGGGYMTAKDIEHARRAARSRDKPGGRLPLTPLELIWLTPDLPEGSFTLAEDAVIGVTGRHENNCTLLPNGGITVLRQSADQDAVNVQMTYGDWGSCHTHPELLAISVCAGSKQILPEVRYHHYGHADFLSWDRQSIAHNTVTVDEVSQYPQGASDDRWAVERGKQATGRPVFFHAGNTLKAFRAKCNAAYDGVELDRTIVLLDDVLVDFFRCRSDEEHQYDYALHVDAKPGEQTPPLSQPQPGPVAGELGYQHLVDVRRGRAEDGQVELDYVDDDGKRQMRLQSLCCGPTSIICAEGHPDLEDNSKEVLILRKKLANVDFVNVMRFKANARNVTASRVQDLPAGLLGVELTDKEGNKQFVLSAADAQTIRYGGKEVAGQLVLMEQKAGGVLQVIDVVP